ncbi:MAG: hypothetical protein KJZ92_08045 [Rhodocyclaceae bacterium]|jgi:hypothetical protein|nr:hypothetical protein [Rhodocyclaceae bacterium]MBZ0144354.1 hypothetical protein [Rhodocyclaceae bacterium]MCC6878612.1 hypothetical protein [Rhodocyclaceae bacterium]MCL4681211.1 hypothetical protein [Rhodocyclaceae bacterium]
MQFPHRLALSSSRRLATCLLLLHFAGLVGLFPLALPPGSKLAMSLAIIASCLVALRRHVLGLAATSVRELFLREDGSVEVTLANGDRYDAAVSGRSTIWPWLVILQLEGRDAARRQPLVILPDALAGGEWRVLRSWLRWKSAEPVPQDRVPGGS